MREELHVRAENAGSVVEPLVLGGAGDRVDKLWRPYICAHHALTRRTSRDYVFVGGRRVPVPCRGVVPGCAVGQGSRE